MLFQKEDIEKIKKSHHFSTAEKLSIIANMMRYNTLTAIFHARSGHIGACFSAADIITVLYHHLIKTGRREEPHDVFILSKGHAAAMLYSVLASKGFFSENKLLSFRKLRGLEGHADMSVPGVDANTGSLGMGISKAKGHALAFKRDRKKFSAHVLVGDGELQEGQNWEAIQSASFWELDNLYLIIDRNRVQTDREVERILDVDPIEKKLRTFGWRTVTVNGHDIKQIIRAFNFLSKLSGKPKAIIANTIKGKGVSFMEHPKVLASGVPYKWHDKVPTDEEYSLACKEILMRISRKIKDARIAIRLPKVTRHPVRRPSFLGTSLLEDYSKCLVYLMKKHPEIVVLDADLSEACGLREIEKRFPRRFIEVGIAEQDMVSTAGALARWGILPIVNTFTSFLTSRANEQIFNNVSEGSKIIYVGHLAGLLPATPGKSHQGLRDISLLKAIPDLLLCSPCNGSELKKLMDFLIANQKSAYLRLEHFPPRRDIQLPKNYRVKVGKGAVLKKGKRVVIFAHGPLLLSEALLASTVLERKGVSTKVIALPWLKDLNSDWVLTSVEGSKLVVSLENHSIYGGQAEEIAKIIMPTGVDFRVMGVRGFGLTGMPEETLKHFGLDWQSVAKSILKWLKKK